MWTVEDKREREILFNGTLNKWVKLNKMILNQHLWAMLGWRGSGNGGGTHILFGLSLYQNGESTKEKMRMKNQCYTRDDYYMTL